MNTLSVASIQSNNDGHRIDLSIRLGEKKYLVYYQTEDAVLTSNPEAFLSILLLPALKRRIDQVEIEGEFSERFLTGINEIQKTFRNWKPNYGEVKIERFRAHLDSNLNNGSTGVFFSAGIDSYYSMLSHLDEVDALVHIDGFDIRTGKESTRKRMIDNIRLVGKLFNKRVIVVQTNVKTFLEDSLAWTLSHGSAIASVGHLLAPEFGKFFIASGGNPKSPPPFGVHPLLDPHWSSDNVEFIHDALPVNKIEKLSYIGQYEPVLSTLRVCLRNSDRDLNCGLCEKCLRTMVYAQVAGIYERLNVFEHELDLKILSKYKRISGPERDLLYIAQSMLAEKGTYTETEEVLRKILFRTPWKKKLIRRGRHLRSSLKKKFSHSRS